MPTPDLDAEGEIKGLPFLDKTVSGITRRDEVENGDERVTAVLSLFTPLAPELVSSSLPLG